MEKIAKHTICWVVEIGHQMTQKEHAYRKFAMQRKLNAYVTFSFSRNFITNFDFHALWVRVVVRCAASHAVCML